MRVVATVHFAMPYRCAGSETVLHELMKAANGAGHEATIYITNRDSERLWTGREPVETFEGVQIVRCRNVMQAVTKAAHTTPDVWVSHHQHVLASVRAARQVGARSVFLTHNDMDLNRRPLRARPDLVIHNSEWVRRSLRRFGTPKSELVFHPPLTPDRHRVDGTGDAFTLVNLNQHKGADLLYRLAQLHPERQFVGVEGGHGVQIIRRNLPNVKIFPHGPDMREVWKRTRVLLMPSVYESYGLVAVEAGVNGIPTIAHPTPGLQENLGAGGMFADRDSPTEWGLLFDQLDDPETYGQASKYAFGLADAAMTRTGDTLKQWLAWIQG